MYSFNHEDYKFNTRTLLELKHKEGKHLQIYHSNTSNNTHAKEEELWSPKEAGVNRVYVCKTSLATP